MKRHQEAPLPGSAGLPAWLAWQADQQPQAIALRHKRLGIWQQWRWAELQQQVAALAAGLAAQGFAAGHSLVLLSHPRPEVLLLSLAAQWLGGEAVALDPQQPVRDLQAILLHLQPRWLLVEDAEALHSLPRDLPSPALLLYAEGRGLQQRVGPGWQAVAQLQQAGAALPAPALLASNSAVAFRFWRVDGRGELQQQALQHGHLLQAGSQLLQAEGLTANEDALASRAFASSAQVRYLLAPWLQAGFRLNFPENLATRDNDRRELGPTLVGGTRETYTRLEQLARSRLPPTGSWQRALVDRVLQPDAGRFWRWAGHYSVIRPLRDVLGFSRTRVPLLLGAPLAENTRHFFAVLGVEVRNWPDSGEWQQRALQPEPEGSTQQWRPSATPPLQA
ncbi:AMP-binding protein [Aquitalea sp. ASV15]|uniref:AMP-binding protein n=1 Tax=Aquitalea sp. ASV15 TaxID=2795104 RepID=UPI0018EAF7F4|nr:AMP-binding protein [Aquitalea sp. ASV15]